MKLKFKIVILVVITAVIGVMIYLYPIESIVLLLLGFGLFVLGTLIFGWEHPKWFVKVYTVFCFFWEIFFYLYFFYFKSEELPFSGIAAFLVLLGGVSLPLIPLWYLWYKYEFHFPKEWYKRKDAEYRGTLQVQLRELKEQLGRGAITQEEYEQRKKKLLEKSEA